MCYLHVVKYHRRVFLTLFIWCSYWFVLTYSTSVHVLSLPSYPLHAVPSYLLLTSCLLQWFQCHPHCLGCSWAAVSVSVSWMWIFCKCWERPATLGGCPRLCVFIPKGLLNVCIPFGICFYWMQMLGLSNSLTNSALWAVLFFKLMNSVIEGNLKPIIQKHWASVSPARS